MNKKIFSVVSALLAALLVLVGFGVWNTLAEKADDGVQKVEYTITTADDLYEILELSKTSDLSNAIIKLEADIVVNGGDAEDWAEVEPSKKWFPIENFAGVFDGQGHTISGLYGEAYGTAMGLFANTSEEAVIRDFKLVNSYFKVQGSGGTAAIVGGTENGGTLEKIYTDAIIDCDGHYTAGIVTVVTKDCSISECWFDGKMIRHYYNHTGGGIVAQVSAVKMDISHCLNSGVIIGDEVKTYARLGGIVGLVSNEGAVNLEDCLSAGSVTSLTDWQVGSVVGLIGSSSNVYIHTNGAYATNESYAMAVGSGGERLEGGIAKLDEEKIEGIGGYQWTNLDFEKYWAVANESTPILKYFAAEEVAIGDAKKAFDISWYNEEATEFTLNTLEELTGLAMLSVSRDFEGITFKLGKDIVVNEGNPEEWLEKAPANMWIPIMNLGGTFDGQGHTISGIYATGGDAMGMFQKTRASSVVKNMKITNSCFNSTTEGDANVGIVSGMGGGTFDTIYTDALVVGTGGVHGGIIGLIDVTGTKISNCWFDGDIRLTTETGHTAGGIAGYVNAVSVIEHCLTSGTISAERETNWIRLGGIYGVNGNASTVTISDCLSATILTGKDWQVGSLAGFIGSSSNAVIETTYATTETYYLNIGSGDIRTKGGALRYAEADLKGVAGYQWTALDFEKYWAINMEGIPVLQSFAKEVPSTANLKKKFDISWYDVSKDTFTLKDAEDLYGMVQLSASGVNFIRKTVTLGANITVNKGDAANWATKAPANKWTPIGTFSGTFDGKGHTISGLYAVDAANAGLFSKTTITATVKNLIVENSYFANKKAEGNVYIGGISSQGGGKFDTIYSDVIIETTGAGVGGIIGWVTEDDASIKNCWFAGEIHLLGETGHSGAGMIGIANGDTLIENCLNSGTISGERTTGYVRAGGICGVIGSSTIVTMNDVLNVGAIISPKWQAGSIAGFIGSSSGIKVNKDGVYTTSESCIDVMGSSTDDRVTGGTVTKLDEMQLKSNKAKTNAPGLNYSKYWTTLAKRTPVLKSFVKKAPQLVNRGMTADTSWYNKDASVYTIKTAAQLYGLEELSYDTDFAGKTIKLGANITINTGNATDWEKTAPKYVWEPVAEFAGTFDGCGYTISGLYNADGKNTGLFGKTTEKATVKNVSIKNSYFANKTATGNVYIGSVAGQGNGTFERIYSNAILKTSGVGLGGLVGYSNVAGTKFNECWFDGTISMVTKEGYTAGGILGIGDADVAFKNCLNSGTISAERTENYVRLGGIIGLIKNAGNADIQDSLNVGLIKAIDWQAGAIVGFIGATSTVKVNTDGVYAVKEDSWGPIGGGTAKVKGSITQVSIDSLKGAKAATSAAGLDYTTVWAAINGKTPIIRYFADGESIVKVMTADTSWYNDTDKEFVIDTVEEFYGFAKLSLEKDFAGVTIKLGADMIVNALVEGQSAESYATNPPENSWNPIGGANGSGKPFAGTFDGQGHTISGIYVSSQNNIGLFGKTTNTAVLKNFSLTDSYITSTSDRDGKAVNIGSVVGSGGGMFDTIYTDAIVTSGGGGVGGILGCANAGSVSMNNCQSAATINLIGESYDGGGFIGDARVDVIMTNCLKSGIITYTSTGTTRRVGGLIGYVRNGNAQIADSVVVGDMSYDEALSAIGAVVGRVSGTSTVAENNDIYVSTKNHTKVVGTGSITGASYVHMIDENQLYGKNAMRSADTLNFEVVWGAVENETPVLRSFAEGKTVLAPLEDEPIVADKNWYNDTDTEFTITTAEQLVGFTEISKTNNFAGKTIKLGADITVNKLKEGETVATWATTQPVNTWSPIGTTDAAYQFAGTFDGQGYTISGIYVAGINNNFGFFSKTAASAVIKNFKLVNSYFVSPSSRDGYAVNVGSIAGSGGGTFSTIYSEAVITCGGGGVGGILGSANVGTATVKNCWFNGTMNLVGESFDGGLVGDVRVATTLINCLNSGIMNISTTDENRRIGGLVGYVRSGSTVDMEDCLAVGSMSCDQTLSNIGSVIGKNSGTVNVEEGKDVYTLASLHTKIVGSGSITGADYVHAIADVTTLHGDAAKTTASTLDFVKYWETVQGSTPVLQLKIEEEGTEEEPEDKPLVADKNWYNDTDTVFTLTTAEELLGFAELSATNSFKNKTIKLGADITLNKGNVTEWASEAPMNKWSPIGFYNGAGTQFAGTFDGCGHTISGVYVEAQNNLGFFGKLATTAVLKKFSLVNSYIYSTSDRNGVAVNIGAIAGSGCGTFDTIYTDAIVQTSGGGVGGFLGNLNNAGTAQMTNCWFAGTINMVGKSFNGGGFVGDLNGSSYKLEMNNCLYTGTINFNSTDATYRVGGMFGAIRNGAQVTLSDSVSAGTINSSNKSKTGAVVGSLENISTSKVTVTAGNTVYSTTECYDEAIGNSQAVSGGGAIVHKAKAELIGTNASDLDFDVYWTSVADSTPVLKCFEIDKSWYSEAEGTTADPYVISTVAEFYGFTELSRSNSFANKEIKLDADIVLNEGNAADWITTAPANKWSPIGFYNGAGTQFAGTFDGQGHTISGVYVEAQNNLGFFGKLAATAVLKNFSLKNSYIYSTSDRNGSAVNIGAIAGSGCGTFDTIYTNAIVQSYGGGIGGFIGNNNNAGTTRMTNCWFDGTINMVGKSFHCGGFVGDMNGASYKLEMDNCLYTGTINFNSTDTTYRVGGMFGAIRNGAQVTLSDSVSAGIINSTNKSKTGAVVGSLENISTSKVTVTAGNTVYSTTECYDEAIGNSQAVSGGGVIAHKAKAELVGTNANDLDFTARWKAITGDTPVLKSFETERPSQLLLMSAIQFVNK